MLILQAQRQAEVFLSELDAAVPGHTTGCYLVGSAALGDWQDKVSNLDVVVVSDDGWDPAQLAAAVRHHGVLGVADEDPRVLYTSFGALAGPDPTGPPAACFEGRRQVATDELDNAMTRTILGEDAVALRGSEWFVVAGADRTDLVAWAEGLLRGRWRDWVTSGRGAGRHWKRKPLAEDLLEVTRLHVAATDGRLVSKVRSGPLALEGVSTRFQRVIADAVGFRRGSRTSMYWGPAERKAHSLELISLLCSTGSGEPGPPAGHPS